MRCIAITNQKGGVGKTTIAINLSAGLAMYTREVLLIDFDPQANATIGLGFDVDLERPSVYDVMAGEGASLSSVTLQTHVRGLKLVPSSLNLASAEITLANRPGREVVLKRKMDEAPSTFDYCIIDCPPSLGLLTVNGLTAAKEVLIPIQMGYFALEGVRQLTRIIELVRQELDREDLDVCGVLANFYDGRCRLSKEILAKLIEHFGSLVFQSVIRKNVVLDEAASHHKTIFEYAPRSRAARAFRDVVLEVIEGESRSRRRPAQAKPL